MDNLTHTYNTSTGSDSIGPPSLLQRIEERLRRWDFVVVYAVTIIIWILFLLSYFIGYNSEWYGSLKLSGLNPWVARVGWIVTTLISYIGIYVLWDKIDTNINLGISMYFVIGTILALCWSVSLYQARNIGASFWFAMILFVYMFWILTYVWKINRLAGALMIPVTVMYLYLAYSMVNLAQLNGYPI
jgi:tryptophan-rich sensory protein